MTQLITLCKKDTADKVSINVSDIVSIEENSGYGITIKVTLTSGEKYWFSMRLSEFMTLVNDAKEG